MHPWSKQATAQPTCSHSTPSCTFLLKFWCFTWFSWVNVWIVPSEFAWLLCATALSVLYNQCSERFSCTSVVWSTCYLPWLIYSWFYSVSPHFTFILLCCWLISLCSLLHNCRSERALLILSFSRSTNTRVACYPKKIEISKTPTKAIPLQGMHFHS